MLNPTLTHFITRPLAISTAATLLLACGDPEETDQPEPPQGPDISLISASLSTSQADLGETVEITASLENSGDRPGPFILELQVDSQTVRSLTRYVDPALEDTPGRRDVALRFTPDEAGTFDLAINDLDAGTLTVTAPEPDLALTGFTAPDDLDAHPVDEPLTLFALLENQGDATGELTLTLFADGDPVAETTAVVPAGVDTGEPLTWTPDAPGTFDLAINDLDAGAVTVLAPPTITLLAPTNEPGEFFLIEGEDSTGLYADVNFSAHSSEPDASFSWSTLADEYDDGVIDPRHLGDGAEITARLYSNRYGCGDLTDHLITLTATSADGLTAQLTHRVILQMGMC